MQGQLHRDGLKVCKRSQFSPTCSDATPPALPGPCRDDLEKLAGVVGVEAGQAMRQALLNKAQANPRFKLPRE